MRKPVQFGLLLACLVCALPCRATPAAFVQGISGGKYGPSDTTLRVAYTSNITGSSLLVGFFFWNSASATLSVADSLGQAWTLVGSPTTSSTTRAQIAYFCGSAGGANAITMTTSSAVSNKAMVIYEVAGVATSSCLDGNGSAASSAGAGTNTITTGNWTTSTGGDYIFAGMFSPSQNGPTITAGTNYVARVAETNANSWALSSEDRVQSTATSSSVATFSTNAYTSYMVKAAAFKPTTGGALYSISGTISGGSGATVTLVNGSANTTTTADGSGIYAFSGLGNGSYTVTPSKAGLTFNPSSRVVSVNGGSVTGVNFAAITYSISGTINGGSGSTVTLTGTASATATADPSGNYLFSGLLNGSYTVTPSKAGVTFNPDTRTVTISGGDMTGINFAALYSVSGTITGGSGSTLTLSGAASATTVADASGNYSFTGLLNGGYTVTPSKSGFTFSPTNTAVTINNGNGTANFTATAVPTYSISGTITGPGTATVTLSGAANAATTANASGNYTFSGLYNGAYTVTPNKTGFIFNPTSQGVTINGQNVAGVNFSAPTYAISGTISGGSGAAVSLSGSAGATITADTLGKYSFTALGSGSYMVTPSKVGFTFNPSNQAVTISSADMNAINFAAVASATPAAFVQGISGGKYGPSDTTLRVAYTSNITGSSLLVGFFFWNSASATLSVADSLGQAWTLVGSPTTSSTTRAQIAYFCGSAGGANAITMTTSSAVSNKAMVIYEVAGVATSSCLDGNGSAASSAGAGTNTITTGNWTTSTGGDYIFAGMFSPSQNGPTITAGTNYVARVAETNANSWALSSEDRVQSTATSSSVATFSTNAYTSYMVKAAAFKPTTGGALYSISGTISGGSGATVTLVNGSANTTTTADGSGIYAFSGLGNGSYTVTPSKAGLTFNPSSRVVSVNGGSVTGVNFAAITYSISGTINGGSGSTVTLTGTATASTTTTGAGTYAFNGLANGTYTVTPSNPGYAFAPANQLVTINGANAANVNFAATALPPAALSLSSTSLSFSAEQGGSTNPASAFVNITNTGTGGALSFTATSSASWLTVFPGNSQTPGTLQISAGVGTLAVGTYTGNITVTASGAQGSPATITVTFVVAPILGDSNLESFADTLSSGQIQAIQATATDTGSVNSLTVYVDPASTASQIYVGIYSDNNGHPGTLLGQGTIGQGGSSILLAGWNSIAISSGNVSTPNVTVGANTPYWIAMLGAQGGDPVYRATSAIACSSENSLAAGLAALPPQWTIGTAGSTCPVSIFAMLTPNISGTILGVPGGQGSTVVTLSGSLSGKTLADTSGNYAFSSLANQTYTVTPSNANYTFTPASRTVNTNSSSLTGIDFTALYSISGTIANGAGITVYLSGPATASTATDASGRYSFAGLANGATYAITPSSILYTFDPGVQTVTINNDNATGINFTIGPAPPTFSISGTLSSQTNAGAGATVMLSGPSTLTTTIADSSGNYSFTGLLASGGPYIVTPGSTTAVFSPTNITVAGSSTDVTGVNFSATGAVFFDDFLGTTLNSEWVAMNRDGDSGNHELQCYLPANVGVSGGSLYINTLLQTQICGDATNPPTSWLYTSAMIQWRSLNFTYGTIEFRAKMPGGTGPWPALWLLGYTCQPGNILGGTDPNCLWPAPGGDEIDITEIGNSIHTVVNQQIHSGIHNDGCKPTTTDVSQNYHVYQLVWSIGSLIWKIDGTTTCTITASYVPSNPMFLIINTAVGGYGGTPVNSTFPQSMLVDYVKITQP